MIYTKKTTAFVFLLVCSLSALAQQRLFTVLDKNTTKLTAEENETVKQFTENPDVVSIDYIDINLDNLSESQSFSIEYYDQRTMVKRIGIDERDKTDLGWFGVLSDETGFVLTELNGTYFSKFYLGDSPYSIYSISPTLHLLIRFDEEAVTTQCLTGVHEGKIEKRGKLPKEITAPPTNNAFLVDDNCNLRVLILYTTAANNALNMQLISQGMVDEANLAYIQSQVNFRMELARSLDVAYTEVNTETNQTIYGATSPVQDDLIRVRNGTNGFGAIPALRNLYRADIVALVRQGGLGGINTFWGQAFGVPTGAFNPAPENGFVLLGNTTSTTLVGGRFSFAHEIGHVQGARHDNHNATPNYARGFVINTGTNGIRTIMATMGTSCSNTNTGCRINFFSNPNVQFGGQFVGTATNDNARRLNETSIIVRNFRVTDDNLTASAETVGNEQISNHLANNTITSSGNLLYQSGSISTLRAGTSVTLSPGFHANAGSQVRVYTTPNPCQALPVNFMNEPIAESRSQHDQTSDLNIYPNPGSDQLNIELPPDSNFEYVFLTDNNGRKLLSQNIGNSSLIRLDISRLLQGWYYIHLVGKDSTVSEKMLIAR
jgi:hypothetical protein